MYKVVWGERVENDLDNISFDIALQIKKKVETHLVKSPKELGKPLKGKYKGLYRYRFGNYRIIYNIVTDKLMIIVLRIAHRADIYE